MTADVTAINNHKAIKLEPNSFRTWKAAFLIQRNWIISIFALTALIGGFMYIYLPDLSGLSIDQFINRNAENFMFPDEMNTAMSRRNFISSTVLGYLPIFYSVFFGATLISRGRDTGAYKYTWTQAIGRQRINFAQVIVVTIPVAISAFVLAILYQRIWSTPLLMAGNFVAPGYFPFINWQYGEFTLQPAVFTAHAVAFFLLAVVIGTLSKRMLIAMGLSFILVFAGLFAYNTVYNKSLNLIAHLTITNDPMYMLPETQQALIKAGIVSKDPKGSPESFQFGSGFIDANGNIKDYDPKDFDQFIKKDLNSGQTISYEGAEYRAITEKMKNKFGFQWLSKNDYPKFVQAYASSFAGISVLLLGLNQLVIRRRS